MSAKHVGTGNDDERLLSARLDRIEEALAARRRTAIKSLRVVKVFNWGLVAYFLFAGLSWLLGCFNAYMGSKGAYPGLSLEMPFLIAFFLSMEMQTMLESDLAPQGEGSSSSAQAAAAGQTV